MYDQKLWYVSAEEVTWLCHLATQTRRWPSDKANNYTCENML